MIITIRYYDKYAECVVANGYSTIGTGFLDESERNELAASFRAAADELADDGKYAALLASHQELLAALNGMLLIVNDSSGVVGYHLNGDIEEWDEFEELDIAATAIARAEKLGGE